MLHLGWTAKIDPGLPMKRFNTDQMLFTILLAAVILGAIIYRVFHFF